MTERAPDGQKAPRFFTPEDIAFAQENMRLALAPIDISRVDFAALYEMGGVIIDAVPADERQKYTYWRAAHLGKIGMNLARGMTSLNAGRDPELHFADSHEFAYGAAKSLVSGIRKTQFDTQAQRELGAATGMPLESPLPTVVFALNEDYNQRKLAPSDRGNKHGFVYRGHLPLSAIDPYSRKVIRDIITE